MRSKTIEKRIQDKFHPQHLEIVDESHQHAGRAGQESHFKVLVVSDQFSGLNRVQRQRQIYQLLDDEFQQGLHALSLRLLTEDEYAKTISSFETPDCQGSK